MFEPLTIFALVIALVLGMCLDLAFVMYYRKRKPNWFCQFFDCVTDDYHKFYKDEAAKEIKRLGDEKKIYQDRNSQLLKDKDELNHELATAYKDLKAESVVAENLAKEKEILSQQLRMALRNNYKHPETGRFISEDEYFELMKTSPDLFTPKTANENKA